MERMERGLSEQQILELGDENYALRPETIFITAPRLASINTVSLSPAACGVWVGFQMSGGDDQIVGTELEYPISQWQTCSVEISWANASTNTGDVLFYYLYGHYADGVSYASEIPSTQAPAVVATAAGQYIKQVTQLSGNIAINPNGENLIRIIRGASDTVLDTLNGSIFLIGVRFTRVS